MRGPNIILALTMAGATGHLVALPDPAPESPAPPMEQDDRVAAARRNIESALRHRLKTAGLPYPPREIFLRAFKREGQLEVWAREDDKTFWKIVTYPLTASSGLPGPKRREGDRQVPEGFYQIEIFNPRSSFHLSLGLNYPNAADRLLGDALAPGTDIYIHGGELSIGCLPLGDAAIEELYLLASDTRTRGQREISVHIFPARMAGPDWERWRAMETATHPELQSFWASLQTAYDAFERTRLVPKIVIDAHGAYSVGR